MKDNARNPQRQQAIKAAIKGTEKAEATLHRWPAGSAQHEWALLVLELERQHLEQLTDAHHEAAE
jgi:hypothetical protein